MYMSCNTNWFSVATIYSHTKRTAGTKIITELNLHTTYIKYHHTMPNHVRNSAAQAYDKRGLSAPWFYRWAVVQMCASFWKQCAMAHMAHARIIQWGFIKQGVGKSKSFLCQLQWIVHNQPKSDSCEPLCPAPSMGVLVSQLALSQWRTHLNADFVKAHPLEAGVTTQRAHDFTKADTIAMKWLNRKLVSIVTVSSRKSCLTLTHAQ